MRALPLAFAAALILQGAAGASTLPIPPVARTYKPPAASPVTFSRIPSGQGFSKGLAKGTRLRSGQTVELVIARGVGVQPPRDCSCQGLGLVQPKGQRLASAYVQVRGPSGRTLASSPPSKLFIEGNGSGGLPIGVTYAFAANTKPFPKGSQLLLYAFFTSR